ncbi:hypothetical protein SLEP1_g34584 [Rubroshorea leprosula]|uniref:Uncharacterized protein n=1 Tax=Rubroshorea leprosula TaxID=152421 RepID=A0AAV5KKF0_9ROSI|nr:hypothetical protein SLEP1_g34584 [Rubroshorea leprosula]
MLLESNPILPKEKSSAKYGTPEKELDLYSCSLLAERGNHGISIISMEKTIASIYVPYLFEILFIKRFPSADTENSAYLFCKYDFKDVFNCKTKK